MKLNVEKELAAMRRMSIGDLRSRYAEVFGETTNTRHKDWLVKHIIWRMHTPAEGDLSERTRRWAEELANDADLRYRPPQATAVAPQQTAKAPLDGSWVRPGTSGPCSSRRPNSYDMTRRRQDPFLPKM